jgi:cobalt/nickel transport system permease protein
MHIPDGILPTSHALIYIIIASLIVVISIIQSRNSLTLKQIPIVGVLAAGLFAAQMFNFPIPAGSSGHIIGTSLATSLVGPWVGILILTAILIIQSFFGDGGFLALGANIINMAIIGAFVTFLFFLVIPKKWREKKVLFATFAGISGFLSTVFMAFFASVELTIAQLGNPGLIFGSMLGLNAIIGVIEGVITFALVFFIFKAQASLFEAAEDSLYTRSKKEVDKDIPPTFRFPVWGAVTSVGIFGVMSVFGIVASENPDGLERTFEFLEDNGSVLNILETGFFGFPEGLGWTILQLAIIMSILFVTLLLINYLVYLVKRRIYNKSHEQDLEGSEVIEDINQINIENT